VKVTKLSIVPKVSKEEEKKKRAKRLAIGPKRAGKYLDLQAGGLEGAGGEGGGK